MTLLEKAKLLADMAENARAAGDVKASIELAIAAAQYLKLVRLFEKCN